MSLRCDAGKGCHFSRTAPALQECVQKCTELRKKWVLLTPKELSTFSGELWLDVGPVGGGFQYLLFAICFNHRNGSMIPSDHNWCLGLATSHQPPASFRHLQGLSVCWCGAKRWMCPSRGKISLLIPPNTGGLWWHGAMREHLGATKHGAKSKFKSGANNWVQAVTIYSYIYNYKNKNNNNHNHNNVNNNYNQ